MAHRKNTYIKIIALIVITCLSVLLIYAVYLTRRKCFAQNTSLFQPSQPPQSKVISQASQASSASLQSFLPAQPMPVPESGQLCAQFIILRNYLPLFAQYNHHHIMDTSMLPLLHQLLTKHSRILSDSNKDRQGGEFRNKIEELFPIGKWKDEIPTEIEERYMYVWIEFIRISSAYFARLASLDDLIEINQQLAKIKDSTHANSPEREQQTIQAAKSFIATTTKTHGRMEDIDRCRSIIQKLLTTMKAQPYFQTQEPFKTIIANIGFLEIAMHFVPLDSSDIGDVSVFLDRLVSGIYQVEKDTYPISVGAVDGGQDRYFTRAINHYLLVMKNFVQIDSLIWNDDGSIRPFDTPVNVNWKLYDTTRISLNGGHDFKKNLDDFLDISSNFCTKLESILARVEIPDCPETIMSHPKPNTNSI
ncbi:hypothetical protein NEHOM01_1063 [Nematocida homosporus]|uniref:uncharacterized protein n=1 Tax=Nematocida homosporus TaxID=1912981 RepID=UPI002220730F|nr:uncharacterized protein NEHOM01_1063 [Nematocida homosporus]KAI5185786.1 hypothetical protein NEHOM01_1063 [Nematocida homosporus]